MGRWLGHAAALAWGMALAMPAGAITVSDMRAVAAAGSPLNVEIELTDLFGIAEKDIVVTPASADEHAGLGMARPAWLDQLHFSVVRGEQGQVLARAAGPQMAPGQRVSFLVMIAWPGHARLQQVSSLVREPGEMPAVSASEPLRLPEPTVIPVQPEAAPATAATTVPAVPGATAAGSDSTVIPAVAEAAPPRTPSAGGTLEVQPGDTLSALAESWDASNLDLAQRQQIIRENNPGAFIGGDINRLRVGARLKLPDLDTNPVSSPRQAASWLSHAERGESASLSRPAVVAAESASAAERPTAADNEVTLTLVAPGKGDQGRAAGADAAAANAGEALETRELQAAAEQARSRLLAERKALSEKLQDLTKHTGEQDARLKVLNERLAAFDRNAPGDIKKDMTKAAADKDSGISAETWVWIVFAGLIAMFVLIRIRSSEEVPLLSDKPAEPQPVFAEFQPLPPDPALAWPEEPADEEYDFLTDSEAEAHQTRLDLAQAYIEMREVQPARDLLAMVQQGGTSEQRQRASQMLQSLA